MSHLLRSCSKRLLILMGLGALCVMPLAAQDDAAAAYAEAERRIEDARLSEATELDLNGLGLKMLPPEIGQLTRLQELYLVNNQITILPSEIGELVSLTRLDLRNNELRALPLELGQLTHLIQLNLYGNSLLVFPGEVESQGTPAILAYLRDYHAMLMRQTIAAVAAGIGSIALVILAFRWRQRRAFTEKKKRL